MYRQFYLYRAFCILLCIFFVSCSTTGYKSAAGKGNVIDAAADSKIRTSILVAMQACPVMASMIATIRATALQTKDSIFNTMLNMIKEQDRQGKTLGQRIVAETRSSECTKRIVELKNEICSHKPNDSICKDSHEIEGADIETLNELFNLRAFRGGL